MYVLGYHPVIIHPFFKLHHDHQCLVSIGGFQEIFQSHLIVEKGVVEGIGFPMNTV